MLVFQIVFFSSIQSLFAKFVKYHPVLFLQAEKDLELDELSSYYKNSYEPKVLITYSDNPHSKTRIFGKELMRIIPNSISRYRQRFVVYIIIEVVL